MSPWDEFQWFDAPTETLFTSPANGVQICKADPRRIILIISVVAGSALTITTRSVFTANLGITIPLTSLPFILTQKDHGPLPQLEWIKSAGATPTFSVIEIRLRDWPAKQPEE